MKKKRRKAKRIATAVLSASMLTNETFHPGHEGKEHIPHEDHAAAPTAVGAQSNEVAVPSTEATATVRERAGAEDRAFYDLITTKKATA